MSRPLIDIDLDGRKVKALVDTGSLNSYIERNAIPASIQPRKRGLVHSALGGNHFTITEECLLEGKIEGLEFSTDAYIVEELGRLEPEGIEFELLLGARALEKYGIKVDPKTGKLDLEGLRRKEFTEY